MVRSMTGFGRAQGSAAGLEFTVEIKSVNSRYFEFNCRLPRGYLFLEDKLKSFTAERVARGKVEMYVSIDSGIDDEITVELNKPYADAYIKALRELSDNYGIPNSVTAADFIGNGEMFKVVKTEIDEEAVTAALNLLGLSGDKTFVAEFSFWTAVPHAIVSTFLPLIVLMMATKLFGKEKSFKPALEAAPFAIFTGLSFSIPMLLVAMLVGYEFASLIAALISISITVVAAKYKFLVPKETWDFGDPSKWNKDWLATSEVSPMAESKMPLVKAWVPYLLIALILVITRIPQLGIKDLLTSGSPFVLKINNLFGFDNLDWSLKWAYIPGTFFVLVSFITNIIHKMNKEQVKNAWKDTLKQVSGAAIALIFGLALVEIMKYKNAAGLSMMDEMANTLAKVGKDLYIFISPFIGVLGAFVSGSATVSMNLFTNLQYNTALVLELPAVYVISMQCVGGAVGNMVCINNAVAASATIGITGKEGKLIKTNAIPMVIYTLSTAAVFYIITLLGVLPSVIS